LICCRWLESRFLFLGSKVQDSASTNCSTFYIMRTSIYYTYEYCPVRGFEDPNDFAFRRWMDRRQCPSSYSTPVYSMLQVPLLFSPLWSLTHLVFSPLFDACWSWSYQKSRKCVIVVWFSIYVSLHWFSQPTYFLSSSPLCTFYYRNVLVGPCLHFKKTELLSLSNLLLTYFPRSLWFCLHVVQ
jgi:hypothetical protein